MAARHIAGLRRRMPHTGRRASTLTGMAGLTPAPRERVNPLDDNGHVSFHSAGVAAGVQVGS
ncbi:hypothetical protein LAUMK7_04494 [Mycobacterium kansasii]|uniref:Uncharacterized protein n=1 Tax=Mycobacterium pseudokansasii TaxID=2341080 RepID=A0A498QW66_9MYCO|nr:hypothetical protein LAUMK7_04494 [Mycobacterium kansasii]VAZ99485.1 hypothetical protein LAUMK35_04352 [Mycobacterium pseudokansasii]VBA30715.1 hypothetical protein LAUMK21_04346 [Mycobacterium pseudokansasii]VBA53709.1 hypothetical protein LAUMK142_04245 [Mycobacterium pseudokansasii]